MNGSMPLPLRGNKHYTVFGGPIMKAPSNMVSVKMAKEVNYPADINIPTQDFCTPDLTMLNSGLVLAVDSIVRGDPVYVGCFGGIGRTGLFLAILAKAFGVEDPVAYVRKHYLANAVETKDQRNFVSDYHVPAYVKAMIANERTLPKQVRRWFKPHNLTRDNRV